MMTPGRSALRCRTMIPPGGECFAPGGECGDAANIGLITMTRHPEMDSQRVLILHPVCAEHVEAEVNAIKAEQPHDSWVAIALTEALGGGLR